VSEGVREGEGSLLSGFVRFDFGDLGLEEERVVNVRVGVSFISIDQARKNLDAEIPDGTSLEETAGGTRAAWEEKLGSIRMEGASEEDKTVFYTSFFHTLQVGGGCCDILCGLILILSLVSVRAKRRREVLFWIRRQHSRWSFLHGLLDMGTRLLVSLECLCSFRLELRTPTAQNGPGSSFSSQNECQDLLRVCCRIIKRLVSPPYGVLIDSGIFLKGGWLPMWKNIIGEYNAYLI
jgi:hypothetical protein